MMSTNLRAAALAGAVALLSCVPTPKAGAIRDTMRHALQADRVPGMQIAVVCDGKVTLEQAYGLANVTKHIPVTARTRFEIGSITKQITAAAILQLKERGELRLTDRLGAYIPEYPTGKDVTLEQLLWQVSGIPDYLNDEPASQSVVSTRPGGLDAALALIKGKPLYFKPGTQWRYSNTNYLLLGAVVARVSHEPFETYVRSHIFTRAGMTESAFVKDERSLPNMAVGYHVHRNGRVVPGQRIRDGWAGGAGAVVSTAGDLARWDIAFFAGKIVSLASVRLATTPDILPSGESTRYGFGWGIASFDGQPEIWHNGGDDGFTAQNNWFPKLHQAVIVLTNAGNFMAGSLADRAFTALHPAIAAAANRPAAGENPAITALARKWLHLTQTGAVDRSELTSRFSDFLTPKMVAFGKQMLGPRGKPLSYIYQGKTTDRDGGVTDYRYKVNFKSSALMMVLMVDRSGRIAGLGFSPH